MLLLADLLWLTVTTSCHNRDLEALDTEFVVRGLADSEAELEDSIERTGALTGVGIDTRIYNSTQVSSASKHVGEWPLCRRGKLTVFNIADRNAEALLHTRGAVLDVVENPSSLAGIDRVVPV